MSRVLNIQEIAVTMSYVETELTVTLGLLQRPRIGEERLGLLHPRSILGILLSANRVDVVLKLDTSERLCQ